MKMIGVGFLIATVMTGCATSGTPSGSYTAASAVANSSDSQPFPTTAVTNAPTHNMLPQIIIPVTGGAPVIGIPVGGNLYLPVTGGPPVIGISTTP